METVALKLAFLNPQWLVRCTLGVLRIILQLFIILFITVLSFLSLKNVTSQYSGPQLHSSGAIYWFVFVMRVLRKLELHRRSRPGETLFHTLKAS